VFNNKLLRLAANDPLPSQVQDDSQPPPVLIGNEEEYEVEAILDEKVGRGQRRDVLVKWVGYVKPTWEPKWSMESVVALDLWELKVANQEVVPAYLRPKKGRKRATKSLRVDVAYETWRKRKGEGHVFRILRRSEYRVILRSF
jgi:hypothetical protein